MYQPARQNKAWRPAQRGLSLRELTSEAGGVYSWWVKVREIVRMLKDGGWLLVRTRGSHHQYKHPTKPGLVTIAGNGNDELAPGP